MKALGYTKKIVKIGPQGVRKAWKTIRVFLSALKMITGRHLGF